MKGYDHNAEDVFRAVGISEEREAELKDMFNDMRKLDNMKKSEIFEMIETITMNTREALMLELMVAQGAENTARLEMMALMVALKKGMLNAFENCTHEDHEDILSEAFETIHKSMGEVIDMITDNVDDDE